MFFGRKKKARQPDLPALSFCDSSTAALEEWLSVLPKSDSGALANQLIRAAREILAAECEPETLQQVAGILGESAQHTLAGLREAGPRAGQTDAKPSQAGDEDLALNGQLLKIRQLGALYGELYARICQQLDDKRLKQDADALILRCSYFLAESIVAAYQLYEAPIPGSWRAFHRCFSDSLQHCKDETTSFKITARYKAVSALACAYPERLSPTQVNTLYHYIVNSTTAIAISAQAAEQHYFATRLDSDDEPGRCFAASQPSADPAVDADADPAMIYFDFALLQQNLVAASVSTLVKSHLEECFKAPQQRQFERVPHQQSVDACTGLAALHYYLSGETPLQQFAADVVTRSGRALPMLGTTISSTGDKQDVWEGVYQGNWQGATSDSSAIEFEINQNSGEQAGPAINSDVQRLTSIDTNPQGFCLSGNSHALRHYKPGRLMGLKAEGEQQWLAGIIRWTRTSETERRLGIELLGAPLVPCAVQLLHSKAGEQLLPALQLPASHFSVHGAPSRGSEANEKHLLVPNLGIRGKCAAILLAGDSHDRAVLQDLGISTPEFCIVSYKMLADSDTAINQ